MIELNIDCFDWNGKKNCFIFSSRIWLEKSVRIEMEETTSRPNFKYKKNKFFSICQNYKQELSYTSTWLDWTDDSIIQTCNNSNKCLNEHQHQLKLLSHCTTHMLLVTPDS